MEYGRYTTMTAHEIFYAHHHCDNPQPAATVTMWGGLECLSCGYEIVVDNHLAPLMAEPPEPTQK